MINNDRMTADKGNDEEGSFRKAFRETVVGVNRRQKGIICSFRAGERKVYPYTVELSRMAA